MKVKHQARAQLSIHLTAAVKYQLKIRIYNAYIYVYNAYVYVYNVCVCVYNDYVYV